MGQERDNRRPERRKYHRIRLGLVGVAFLVLLIGLLGWATLSSVRVRTSRLVERAVEPLGQTSLYGLELGRMGARFPGPEAAKSRLDSLERAYSETYLDTQDIRQFGELREVRRRLKVSAAAAPVEVQAGIAFRKVVEKNLDAAREMAEHNRVADMEAAWFILVLSLVGAAGCISVAVFAGKEEAHDIERTKAQRTLDRSEARFRSLVEKASIAIRISRAGRTVYANRACLDLFGYPDLESFLRTTVWGTYEPGERAMIDRRLAMRKDGGQPPDEYDSSCLRRDGTRFDVHVSSSYVELDGGKAVVGFLTDTTESVRARDALVRSESRFRTLVEDASLAIRITQGGRTIYANRACVDLFGYPDLDSLLKVPHRETYHPDDRELIEERFRIRAAGGMPPREYDGILLRKDGSHFHAHISTAFVAFDEGEAVVGFLVDTTESVHAAEREEAQREQLIHADRMASLGVLLAGMAHEINNPNNLAMFNAELLERILSEAEPVLDAHHARHPDFALSGIPYLEMKPEVHALVEGIRGSTLRIRDIISGLKDFSRRNPVSDHRPVDLSQVVQSSLLLVGNLVRKSTDRFESDLAEPLPKVDGDPQRLEQVVLNLLTNACQALPARDRLLRVRTRMSEPGTVELEVEDEGVGIASENLPKILDPFFTTKREEGGTGLGLAVSWAIVQAHRGQLTFLPREGGGTRAILRLPASKPRETA